MEERRGENGARLRNYGTEDDWCLGHRTKLPKNCHMVDMDIAVGVAAFAVNSSDKKYFEIAPDSYDNSGQLIRKFGLVAIIEHKRNMEAAEVGGAVFAEAFYLHMCRIYREVQPIAPRFFFVIGFKEPLRMYEVCIDTGALKGEEIILGEGIKGWEIAWRKLGLVETHQNLENWLVWQRRKP